MVVMGRIVAPYGVFGWLKVVPDTEVFDGLFEYGSWWIGRDDNWREYNVETAKVHNDVLVVKLKGIDDRDAAFACKSMQVAVPRALLPIPDENEYYWSDLIGVQVKNQQGIDFGVIVEVFETGANDVIVTHIPISENDAVVVNVALNAEQKKQKSAKPQMHERLIPFIDDVVLEVDTVARTMLVNWDKDF
jgi:16S rRNA processing protein RimM